MSRILFGILGISVKIGAHIVYKMQDLSVLYVDVRNVLTANVSVRMHILAS